MGLYFKETGNMDAPIIVFLHGGGVSGWMWNKQIDFFKDYHLLIPDIESHGNSLKEHFISIPESAKKLIKPAFKMTFGLIKNRRFSKLQAKQLYISDEDFETYFEESKRTSLDDLIQVIESNMSYILPQGFRNSKVKTMVLVGSKEKGVMLKSAQDMLRSNKYCKGYSVPGIGHGVSLADPQLFNKIAKAWIENGNLPEGLVPILHYFSDK